MSTQHPFLRARSAVSDDVAVIAGKIADLGRELRALEAVTNRIDDQDADQLDAAFADADDALLAAWDLVEELRRALDGARDPDPTAPGVITSAERHERMGDERE